MKNLSLVFGLALVISGIANAQDSTTAESQSKMTVEEAKDSKNKVAGDIDAEITNAKLRAESGSKSRWSASLTTSYNGSSLEKPFDNERPNPDHAPVPPRVNMGGNVEARYRIDKNQSLTAGTGYIIQTPLQGIKEGDVSTPYVSYNYVGKIGKVQNIAAGQLSAATSNDDLTIGTIGAADVSDTIMYDFNGSRFSVGLTATGDYTMYKDNKDSMIRLHGKKNSTEAGNYQADYAFALYPMAEYAVSDKISLRTLSRTWVYNHGVFNRGSTYDHQNWVQSFGVGWAVTRDIYLYPNFQWDWEQWRGKDYSFANSEVRANSTVGLQATINIF